MMLPGSVDYDAAIQSPAIRLDDPELKRCKVQMWPMGGPRVRSGGFALTYRLEANNGAAWAVRCFHQEVPDLQTRYAAISQALPALNLNILTDFKYLERGIQVGSNWYPVVKMPWVDGETLCVYIHKHLSDRAAIERLARGIREVARQLDHAGVAHGDLQDGNIIVQSDGSLKLIDYDSFYVPSLQGRSASNRGVPAYQHPRRTDQDFGPTLDRFSLLVLYLGISGVAAKPDLWSRFSQGDQNILLAQKDFLDPDYSDALRELEQIPALTQMVRSFRSICKGSQAQVPRLEDFIRQAPIVSASTTTLSPITPWAHVPVIDASDRNRLLALAGSEVEVIGYVDNVFYDPDRVTVRGEPYAMVNFGIYRSGAFVIPLWSDVLRDLLAMGRTPWEFERRWIRITGLLSTYVNPKDPNRIQQPEIIPEWHGRIILLSEQEAMRRLSSGAGILAQLPPPAPVAANVPVLRAARSQRPSSSPATPDDVASDMERMYASQAKPPVAKSSVPQRLHAYAPTPAHGHPNPGPQHTKSSTYGAYTPHASYTPYVSPASRQAHRRMLRRLRAHRSRQLLRARWSAIGAKYSASMQSLRLHAHQSMQAVQATGRAIVTKGKTAVARFRARW